MNVDKKRTLVDILNTEISIKKLLRAEKYYSLKLGRKLGLHKMDPLKCLLMTLACHAGGKTAYWVAYNEKVNHDYLEASLFTIGGYALSTLGWVYFASGGYKIWKRYKEKHKKH